MKKIALIGLIVTLLVPTAALADASDFEFDPETGSILKYVGTELEVVVPDEINGVPVVRIGYDAFVNEDVQITSIVLPEGLEIIDEDAFHYQGSLQTVDCPDSVRVIAEDAFNYGYFSEEFDWPESLEEIGECAFYNTRLSGTIVLPPNVATIGESAFGVTEVETIVLPSADIQIEANAFEDCEKLKQIVFPAAISDEKLAEFAELFAEMNPDAEVVRGEPAISEEDSALPEVGEASASEPVSVEPVPDVKYICEKAAISGYDIDPSILGGEYSVTFHSDGSLTLIFAGAVIDDLEWRVEDDALAADYYGAGEFRFVPGEQGYELDYMNAVRFYFTAD